jgi:hypothetical protein
MGLAPEDILACFGPYRPDGYATASATANLEGHLAHPGFRRDLLDLLGEETEFNVDEAAALVTGELLARLDQLES